MDVNTKAFDIVRRATSGETETLRSAVARKAGKVGGKARAKALSEKRRTEIARKASLARWQRSRGRSNG